VQNENIIIIITVAVIIIITASIALVHYIIAATVYNDII